jgi:hypothetical protein
MVNDDDPNHVRITLIDFDHVIHIRYDEESSLVIPELPEAAATGQANPIKWGGDR